MSCTHKRPTCINDGTVVELHENVYCGSGSIRGQRSSLLRVIGDPQGSTVLVEVLGSKGYNAHPAGVHIKRPVSNLKIGNDYTQEVQEYFKDGGTVKHTMGAAGGYLVGNKHSAGGIPGINKSTGQHIEVEGGEVIITAPAVDDNAKREFEGEQLTNRQILSRINVSGGGVSFETGGQVSSCKCSGKSYKFGGETMTDYQIVNRMNKV